MIDDIDDLIKEIDRKIGAVVRLSKSIKTEFDGVKEPIRSGKFEWVEEIVDEHIRELLYSLQDHLGQLMYSPDLDNLVDYLIEPPMSLEDAVEKWSRSDSEECEDEEE